MGHALAALIEMLVQVVIDLITWAWDGTGGDGDGIKSALDGLWDKIKNWFKEHDFIRLLFGNTRLTSIPDNPYKRTVDRWRGEDTAFSGMNGGKSSGTGVGRTKEVAENTKNAADATGVSATNLEKSATVMAVNAKNSEKLADGMIQVADETGRVHTMTVEQAKALMDGKAATEQTAGAVTDLGGAASQTTGKLSGTAAVMNFNITAGTIARTAVLLLALTNQLLSAMGKSPLPIESATVEQLITAGITTIAALIAWWKNNSFTKEAIAADAEYDRLRKRNGK